ncbi:MAG TPA: hypothetical protein VFZ66_27890 [Herpetosiphonaceae bacterium]
MSCDNNRAAFTTKMAADPAVAAALGNGDSNLAASVLESVYQTAKSQAERTDQRQWRSGDMSPSARAAFLAAQAGCTALFHRMLAAKLKPPVHGKPRPGHSLALPKSAAAQAGYAAIEQTLRAIEQGKPLPDVTHDLLAARGVRQHPSGPQRTVTAQMDALAGHLGTIPVDPDRPPLAGFLTALMRGALDPATMSEDELYQSMTRLIRTEEMQQAFMRVPRLLDLARGDVADGDPALRRELDRAAEGVVSAADDRDEPVPPALAAAAAAYQADPSTAAAFAVALAETAGLPRCPQCGQFQDAAGQHACAIRSVIDTFPALRVQTEPPYQDRQGLEQLTAPAVHAALTRAAQGLCGPAVPSRVRAAAETYLGATATGPSAAATRAFVAIVWAAGETTPATEQSHVRMREVIARRIEQLPCLNLVNGIHDQDARPAIAGLRGTANGLLSTPDAPIDWRLAAAAWQQQRPFNDWSPTAAHDVAFARFLAETSGLLRCPQCQQFMSPSRDHGCPAILPAAPIQVTPTIVAVASGRGSFPASFRQPSPDLQALVDLAQALAADPQTYGTARGAAANFLMRLHELETRYAIGVPVASLEGACLDLARAACEDAGLIHCGGCPAYVADPAQHDCPNDGSGWSVPRVIDEAVTTLATTPTLVDWLNRQRHAGLAASDALTDDELSAVLSAMVRFEDGAIDDELSTGAYALLTAVKQVGRVGLDTPQRGGTLQERIAAMALVDLLCRRAGRQRCPDCGAWMVADGSHACLTRLARQATAAARSPVDVRQRLQASQDLDDDARAAALGQLIAEGHADAVVGWVRQEERPRLQVRTLVQAAATLQGVTRQHTVQAALTCAAAIADDDVRAHALVEVARALGDRASDGPLADRALELARRVRVPAYRARALAQLVPLTAPDAQAAVVAEALTDLQAGVDSTIQYDVLSTLGATTPAAHLEPVVRATTLLKDTTHRDIVRSIITETLARGSRHVAASIIVDGIRSGELRSKAIVEIATSTTIPVGAWAAFYRAAERIRAPRWRAPALAALEDNARRRA